VEEKRRRIYGIGELFQSGADRTKADWWPLSFAIVRGEREERRWKEKKKGLYHSFVT